LTTEIGKKIRDAELAKVPFMLIVGEKESEQNEVSVRQRGVGDLGSVAFEKFIEMINIAVNRELSTEI
jgi:threonyl-tRNA synthetase